MKQRIGEALGAILFEIWYYIPHLIACLFLFGTLYLWMVS
jgi:hypothetical protein